MRNYRQATPVDMETLLVLADLLVELDIRYDPTLDPAYSRSAEGRAWLTECIQNPDSCVLIAELEGRPVGMLIGRMDEPSPWRKIGERLAELEMFCVEPGIRGRGLGRGLLDAFAAWAKERKAERLWVRVSAGNADAIRFYKRELFSDYDVILERRL